MEKKSLAMANLALNSIVGLKNVIATILEPVLAVLVDGDGG